MSDNAPVGDGWRGHKSSLRKALNVAAGDIGMVRPGAEGVCMGVRLYGLTSDVAGTYTWLEGSDVIAGPMSIAPGQLHVHGDEVPPIMAKAGKALRLRATGCAISGYVVTTAADENV